MQRIKNFIRSSCATYKKVANGVAGMSFVLLIALGSSVSTYWVMSQSFDNERMQLRADHAEELTRLAYAYGRVINNEVLPEVREALTIANEAAATANTAATKAEKAVSKSPTRIPPVQNDKITEAERARINQKVQEANCRLGVNN